MKLSAETLAILKNFATINQGIYFRKGNVLSTTSQSKNILVDARIIEEIPQDFGIYDLNNFLSVMSLFRDGVEFEFDDIYVVMKSSDNRTKIKYRITDPTMIVYPGDKRPKLPSIDVQFDLTLNDFNWITKAANVLSVPNISVTSDGEKVELCAFDVEDSSTHTNSIQLPIEGTGREYNLIFKNDNLKLFPGDYTVQITSKGFAKFVGKGRDIVYYISIETQSTFGE